MSTVQVRMEVPNEISASVHYIAQSLGIPVKEAYTLIVALFLFERDLDKAVMNLEGYQLSLQTLAEASGSPPF